MIIRENLKITLKKFNLKFKKKKRKPLFFNFILNFRQFNSRLNGLSQHTGHT